MIHEYKNTITRANEIWHFNFGLLKNLSFQRKEIYKNEKMALLIKLKHFLLI